ncbi:hypothetical protein P7K49_032509, partial [Saguinus oedipus]
VPQQLHKQEPGAQPSRSLSARPGHLPQDHPAPKIRGGATRRATCSPTLSSTPTKQPGVILEEKPRGQLFPSTPREPVPLRPDSVPASKKMSAAETGRTSLSSSRLGPGAPLGPGHPLSPHPHPEKLAGRQYP